MSHIRAVALLVSLAFVPACARRPAEPPPAPPPVVIAPEPSGSMSVEDDTIPPPRPVHREPADESLAFEGRKLFLKLQCATCHTARPDAKGPNLEGLFGSKVALKGGGAETADENYIIESIRRPRLKVVEGWEPIMPVYFEQHASNEDVNALVAYIRSLKRGDGTKEERFPLPVGAPTERPKELAPPPREK